MNVLDNRNCFSPAPGQRPVSPEPSAVDLSGPSDTFVKILAYGRPLNLFKCADNSADTNALYHCTVAVNSATGLTHWLKY